MAKVKLPTTEEITGLWQASGLKEKLIFTFLMIAVFRLGAQIPLFGVNAAAIKGFAGANNLIGFLDMFSGGALGRISIFALGIGPYITASIIMQLVAVVIPSLEKLQKEEGEAGRRKISQYTRVFTVGLALFQSIILVSYLTRAGIFLSDAGWAPLMFLGSVITMTTGSVFLMWLAELITEKGIGNGGSLLIFIGILSKISVYSGLTAQDVGGDTGKLLALMVLLVIFFGTIFLIVIMQEAIRKVVVVNARRQVGNKVYGGVSSHIPFKLNPGGVMPIIFAVAILLFPSTVLQLLGHSKIPIHWVNNLIIFLNNHVFNPSGLTYYLIYFILIVALTFFYASIMPNMQPKDIANNLKKYGSSIPGIKPGKPTADTLDVILTRITFIGAVSLGVVALIPNIATHFTGVHTLQGIGATSLIIMVGVALDFINQIKTHLLVRQYEGFLKQ